MITNYENRMEAPVSLCGCGHGRYWHRPDCQHTFTREGSTIVEECNCRGFHHPTGHELRKMAEGQG